MAKKQYPIREYVLYRLRLLGVSREDAARKCGISEATLYRKLREPLRLNTHEILTLAGLGSFDPLSLMTAIADSRRRASLGVAAGA